MPLWRRLTSGTATEKDFWRRCRRRGQDLGDVGGSIVNQLKRSCFEHETKEFLVGFSFKGDRLSIETFVQKDFIWWQVLKARVTKDESIVHVADVFDEKVCLKLMDQICSLMETTMRQSAGDSGLPIGLPLRRLR